MISNSILLKSVSYGIGKVNTISGMRCGEVVLISAGSNETVALKGLIINIMIDSTDILLFGGEHAVLEGSRVILTGSLLEIDFSFKHFGSVLNSMGDFVLNINNTIDNEYLFFKFNNFLPILGSRIIEQKAKGIIERVSVRKPLLTGIKVVDSLIPIGRGQRELIIGDRQTGKTSIIIDSIINYVNYNNNFFLYAIKATAVNFWKKFNSYRFKGCCLVYLLWYRSETIFD